MKIKRISFQKINIEQNLEIVCNGNVIDTITIYDRYKLKQDSEFSILLHSDKVVNKISQKYGIKKKFITIKYSSQTINFEGRNITSSIANSVVFNDLVWYRDFKIRQIIQ